MQLNTVQQQKQMNYTPKHERLDDASQNVERKKQITKKYMYSTTMKIKYFIGGKNVKKKKLATNIKKSRQWSPMEGRRRHP